MDAPQRYGDNVVPLRPHGEIPGSPVAFDEAAKRDRLTGLPGLAAFEDALRGAANRRRGGEHPWVAVAGLDGLSPIVARTGPEAADVLTRSVADRLRDSLRGGDQLARISATEFGLIVDAPFGDEATAALERVARSMRDMIARDERWKGAVVSIGLSPLWPEKPSAAMARAREGLETARRMRPGSVVVSQ
jgi:diguanylate cyclase (GGDEF)-like protein